MAVANANLTMAVSDQSFFTPHPSPLTAFPGISPQSTEAVKKALKHNHERNHCFFNDRRFHNHLPHHLLAAYTFGAPPETIEKLAKDHIAKYDLDKFKLDRDPATGKMLNGEEAEGWQCDDTNWTEKLGDEKAYWSYLAFFRNRLSSMSVAEVLTRYIFSPDANKPSVEMINRLFSGILHPIIHTGYGLEFSLPSQITEGLAMAAVHKNNLPQILPPDWIQHMLCHDERSTAVSQSQEKVSQTAESVVEVLTNKAVQAVTQLTGKLGLGDTTSDSGVDEGQTSAFHRTATAPWSPWPPLLLPPHHGPTLFDLVEMISSTPELLPTHPTPPVLFSSTSKLYDTLGSRGDVLREVFDKYQIDVAEVVEDGWWATVEELVALTTCLLTSITRPGHTPPRMDFFLVHCLNSTLFLPCILPHLSPAQRMTLLHCQLRVVISCWVSRGAPPLYVRETLMAATARPAPPKEEGSKEGWKIGNEAEEGVNPWEAMLSAVQKHQDEHLLKAVRTLAFASARFGDRPAGYYASQSNFESKSKSKSSPDSGPSPDPKSFRGISGLEMLDGTAYTRAAGLLLDGIGWSAKWRGWEYTAIGFEEAWTGEEGGTEE